MRNRFFEEPLRFEVTRHTAVCGEVLKELGGRGFARLKTFVVDREVLPIGGEPDSFYI